MAEVLVYVDHVDGAVRKPTLELLTLARRLGEPVAVPSRGCGEHRVRLAEHGAVKVLTHDAPEYADYLVVPKVDALQAAYEQVSPAAVLVPSSPRARRSRPSRRPHRFRHHHRRRRPGGRRRGPGGHAVGVRRLLHHQVPVSKGPRSSPSSRTRAAVEAAPAAGAVEALNVSFSDKATGTKVTGRTPRESTGRPELTEAAIVSPVAAASTARRTSRSSRRWPTPWVRPSVPRVPPSTPAGTRTPTRSARPARACPRSCTSPPASRVRSSTGPVCRPRRRSWRSTRTPRRRSSTWSTTAWWATSSTSPQLTRRSRPARLSDFRPRGPRDRTGGRGGLCHPRSATPAPEGGRWGTAPPVRRC